MKRFTSLLAVLTAALFLGVGCTDTNLTNSTPTTSNDDVTVVDDESIEVLTEDAYGKDLTMADRYPDSIRSYYAASQYETDVSYQTTATQEAVREFYTDTLTAAGWTNSEEATDYMEYIKGDEANPEILTLYLTDYAAQAIVEYELVYEPALSDEELQALESEDF